MPRARRAARVEVTLTGPAVVKDLFEGSAEGTSPMSEWPWVQVRVMGIEQPIWIVPGTDNDGRPVITGLLLSPKQNGTIQVGLAFDILSRFALSAVRRAR
jgi:hypothetical protein